MKIGHHSLKHLVAQRLRQEIFEGVHRPGAHLVEQSLADLYGVSRGPIREAIQQLEQEGLVQVLPRKRTIVTEMSPEEAWEIYFLRGQLEGMAVNFAAHHWTAEHSGRLSAILAEMDQLGPQDWFRAIELDQQFHHLIVTASGNGTLIRVYQSLDSKVFACFLAVKRYLGGLPMEMAQRHRSLSVALEQGEYLRGEILAIEHWLDTGARLRSLVSGERSLPK